MKPLVLSGKNKIVKDAASGEKSKTKAQIENGSGRSIYIYIYIYIIPANFSTLLQALRRSINLIPFSLLKKQTYFMWVSLLYTQDRSGISEKCNIVSLRI